MAKVTKLQVVNTVQDAAFQIVAPERIRELIESRQRAHLMDVLVTADVARVVLEYNTPGVTNRHIHPRAIVNTKKVLTEKAWINTGEPVIISDAKLVSDGQHRLESVVETGIPAIMDISFGIKREAYINTNTGMKRTGGDALLALGVRHNGIQIAAAARMALAYERSQTGSMSQVLYTATSNAEIVNAVKRWPDLVDSLTYTHNMPVFLRTSGVRVLGFFAHRTANEASIREFFDILITGEGHIDNPPHRLRERLITGKFGTNRRIPALALGIIAWNAWMKGKTVSSLTWNPSKGFPKVNRLDLSENYKQS